MSIPVLIFILFISAFYGCVFHLFVGGNVFHVFAYIIISILGFMAGHVLCNLLGNLPFSSGTVHFGWGTLGSVLLLLLSLIFSRPLF